MIQNLKIPSQCTQMVSFWLKCCGTVVHKHEWFPLDNLAIKPDNRFQQDAESRGTWCWWIKYRSNRNFSQDAPCCRIMTLIWEDWGMLQARKMTTDLSTCEQTWFFYLKSRGDALETWGWGGGIVRSLCLCSFLAQLIHVVEFSSVWFTWCLCRPKRLQGNGIFSFVG